MKLNRFGEIVNHAWHDLPNHYPYVTLDAFCLMPNHVHGIIILNDDDGEVGAGLRPAPKSTGPAPTPTIPVRHPLSEIVRAFKSFSARHINEMRGTHGLSVWQRNYYEHIIRDNTDYIVISNYILNNPLNWKTDDDNQERVNPESGIDEERF
jgi:putative transposase